MEVEGFLPAVALSISKRLLAEVVKACIGEGLAVRWQELFLYCCMLVLAAIAQVELTAERAVPEAWEERAVLPWVQAPQQVQASIVLAQMIDTHRVVTGAKAYKEGAQAARWLVLVPRCCKLALVKRSVVLGELAAQAWELPSLGPEVEVVAGLLELPSQLEQAEEALLEGQLQVMKTGKLQGARVEAVLLKEELAVH